MIFNIITVTIWCSRLCSKA